MRQLTSTELKRLHRERRRSTQGDLALILHRVLSPLNVGSICRSAAALRATRVWCCAGTPAAGNAPTQRTGRGSSKYLDAKLVEDTADAVAEAKRLGYLVVALELADTSLPLHEVDLPATVCFLVGNEDQGLSPAVLAQADAAAYVPLLGRIGSLNVAASVSIALYEARRQQWSRTNAPTPGSTGGGERSS